MNNYGATLNLSQHGKSESQKRERLTFSFFPIFVGLLFSAAGILLMVSVKHPQWSVSESIRSIQYSQVAPGSSSVDLPVDVSIPLDPTDINVVDNNVDVQDNNVLDVQNVVDNNVDVQDNNVLDVQDNVDVQDNTVLDVQDNNVDIQDNNFDIQDNNVDINVVDNDVDVNIIDNNVDINIIDNNVDVNIVDNNVDVGVIDNNVVIDNFKTQELEFSLYRDGYAALDLHHDFLIYSIMDGFDAVIEPYVPNRLLIISSDTTVYYTFSVCIENENADTACEYGSLYMDDPTKSEAVTLACQPYDALDVEVSSYDSATDEVIQTTTGSALCMYVRREIRDLTEADLAKTMDAMHKMWVVTDEEGREIYGDNFHDAKYLLEFHHFNAAWQDADHIHEGNGFLPQHIKMTNIVELAMQAVDPSVTIPYWDFTIDSANDSPVAESPIMSADYFGSMTSPVNPRYGFTYSDDSVVQGGIPDGRWAFIKADVNDKYPDLIAGYGYMRAPWNMNPSPYVSRYTANMMIGTQLPTCSSHYDILQEFDFMDFLINFEDDPHATTHSLIGGTYGCDLMIPLLESGYISDETSLLGICANWVFYMKEFYRYNYLLPLSGCDATIPDEAQCGYTCVNGTYEDMKFSLNNKISNYIPSDMDDDGWSSWMDFICEGDGQRIFSGDHLESASPSDPSFWPIHTTLERLTHAKLMTGGFATSTWAYDPKNDYVCAKGKCYEPDFGFVDYWSECCQGHYQNDQLLDAITGNKSSFFGPTNDETMRYTDPFAGTYTMPYIYDSFSWSHCDEDFEQLLSALHNQAVETFTDTGDESITDTGDSATKISQQSNAIAAAAKSATQTTSSSSSTVDGASPTSSTASSISSSTVASAATESSQAAGTDSDSSSVSSSKATAKKPSSASTVTGTDSSASTVTSTDSATGTVTSTDSATGTATSTDSATGTVTSTDSATGSGAVSGTSYAAKSSSLSSATKSSKTASTSTRRRDRKSR